MLYLGQAFWRCSQQSSKKKKKKKKKKVSILYIQIPMPKMKIFLNFVYKGFKNLKPLAPPAPICNLRKNMEFKKKKQGCQ